MIKSGIDRYPAELNERLWVLGNYYFHIYLIKGDKYSALIESGVSATFETVTKQLASLDAIPDYLIVTHPHGDHINGLPGLREAFPGASVIAGSGAAEFISNPKIGSSLVYDDAYITGFLFEQGLIQDKYSLTQPPSLEKSIIKKEGDSINLGGISLIFYPVYGHSPGNLALYSPEIKTLFVSDSLGFYYPDTRFFPVFFTGYDEYMGTIDWLESFNPQIVAPAHQAVFRDEDVHRAFYMARSDARGLRKRIRSSTMNDDDMVRELFNDYYRDELRLYPGENILGCCRLLVRRSRI
jgi:glyoxylase-like metal-dependent hydrolase (beta-lactamase superfamily II)